VSDIVLHLGAHRTGSTMLQTILDANAALLAEAGVRVLTPPRPGKRDGITVRDTVKAVRRSTWLPLAGLRDRVARRAGAGLRALIGGTAERLVISDEMLLGRAYGRDGTGLYPQVAGVLAAFRLALDAPVAEVHLTVRAYDSFLVSVYAMRALYAGRQPAFDTLRPRLLALDRGWPLVVDDIAAAFPEARLHLGTVEHTPLARRLVGLVGAEAAASLRYDPGARSNVAPSLAAIEAARTRRLRHAEADALVARLAGGPAFDPLTAAEKASLRARYTADLAAMRAHPRWRLDDAGQEGAAAQ
jgi:hypothetical protein